MKLRQMIGLKAVQFKLRLFDSFSCTRSQSAAHSRPPQELDVRTAANMPVDLNGYWKMISNENFEEYLKALGEQICKTSMEGLA